jgi:hypothetical protein
MELGKNCLESSDDANHEIISEYDNKKRTRSRIVTLDLDPGMTCWFEAFNDFKIAGNLTENTQAEIDNLSVFYFPYTGEGASIYLEGNNQDNCNFPPVDTPYDGQLDNWFDVNLMGGSCGYMILLTTKEYYTEPSRFEVYLDYDF